MEIVSQKYSFKIRKIRIGDSVGKNLFGTWVDIKNNEINICTNQAISIVGQILLIEKLAENNDLENTIIEGYFLPESLLNNLNQEWTRNYFLKKFYNQDWFLSNKIINKSLRDSIDYYFLNQYSEKSLYDFFYIKGKCLLSYPSFFSNFSYCNQIINRNNYLIKYFSNYLKMKVRFYSNPIVSSKLWQERKNSNLLREKYGIYFSNPVILHDSFFIEDKIHLRRQFRLNNRLNEKFINY